MVLRASRVMLLAAVGLGVLSGLPSQQAHAQASGASTPQAAVVDLAAGRTNCSPVTAADGDGVLAVSVDLRAGPAGVILARRWSPEGGWSPALELSGLIEMPLSCDLAAASDGRLAVVAWSGYLPDGGMVLQGAVRPDREASWQPAATLMAPGAQPGPDGADAEPARHWAVVSAGQAVVAWNTWVGANPELGGIGAAAWQAGTWHPGETIFPGVPGQHVYAEDVLPTPAGAVVVAHRGPSMTWRGDLTSRLLTASSGWQPEVILARSQEGCRREGSASSGSRIVMLEACESRGSTRLRVREWLGGEWSAPIGISPRVRGLRAQELAVSGSAAAVAYEPEGDDRMISVVRSGSPGDWPGPVPVVTAADEATGGWMLAMAGADAVVVWTAHPADARPGEIEEPMLARTLRADGRLTSDVRIGYGLPATCRRAASDGSAAVFTWSMFCGGPFRIASWDGSGPWTRVRLRPDAASSVANSAPLSVTAVPGADVVAWQAERRVVAAAVRRPG